MGVTLLSQINTCVPLLGAPFNWCEIDSWLAAQSPASVCSKTLYENNKWKKLSPQDFDTFTLFLATVTSISLTGLIRVWHRPHYLFCGGKSHRWRCRFYHCTSSWIDRCQHPTIPQKSLSLFVSLKQSPKVSFWEVLDIRGNQRQQCALGAMKIAHYSVCFVQSCCLHEFKWFPLSVRDRIAHLDMLSRNVIRALNGQIGRLAVSANHCPCLGDLVRSDTIAFELSQHLNRGRFLGHFWFLYFRKVFFTNPPSKRCSPL